MCTLRKVFVTLGSTFMVFHSWTGSMTGSDVLLISTCHVVVYFWYL